MSSEYQIRPSSHERKIDFHGRAPEARQDTRYGRRPNIRMAGQIFPESSRERKGRLERERMGKIQKQTPVGYGEVLGFAQNDSFGPDNSYESKERISYKHDREY